MASTLRLDTIKALIEHANTIADVGCDHAIIAKYCIDSGLAEKVIASDISDKCLDKARKLLGDNNRVDFKRCDGLDYICDEAVIAGMGGLLIKRILLNARSLPKTLIVCPHRDCDEVRKTLLSLGYGITDDIDITERAKFYSVIRAKFSEGERDLDELQLLFGINVKIPNTTLQARLNKLYDMYMIAPRQNEDKLRTVIAAMSLQGMKH